MVELQYLGPLQEQAQAHTLQTPNSLSEAEARSTARTLRERVESIGDLLET